MGLSAFAVELCVLLSFIHLIIYKSCTYTDESEAKLLHYFGDSLKIFSFFQRLEDRKSVAR